MALALGHGSEASLEVGLRPTRMRRSLAQPWALGYATSVSAAVREIEVQNVTRVFGATAALRGVSCRFLPGSITFIQGANGAGKSTLLGIIGTALRPTSGRVLYHPFGSDQSAARRQLGWVGHESHCYRELTGRENVAFAGALHGIHNGTQVLATCERVGAAAFLDQPVSTLSRGQRQRVALARALVHNPGILLLDEPQTGLDAATMERFDTVLHEEKARGAIIIVVSHQGAWAQQWDGVKLTLERGKLRDRT